DATIKRRNGCEHWIGIKSGGESSLRSSQRLFRSFAYADVLGHHQSQDNFSVVISYGRDVNFVYVALDENFGNGCVAAQSSTVQRLDLLTDFRRKHFPNRFPLELRFGNTAFAQPLAVGELIAQIAVEKQNGSVGKVFRQRAIKLQA